MLPTPMAWEDLGVAVSSVTVVAVFKFGSFRPTERPGSPSFLILIAPLVSFPVFLACRYQCE